MITGAEITGTYMYPILGILTIFGISLGITYMILNNVTKKRTPVNENAVDISTLRLFWHMGFGGVYWTYQIAGNDPQYLCHGEEKEAITILVNAFGPEASTIKGEYGGWYTGEIENWT